MMSFGSTSVGEISPTDELPGKSFLVGLLANALGFDRADHESHQRLQDRLVMAAALVERGREIEDFQTARLDQHDIGWTTRGAPEGRAKTDTFQISPDERRRTGSTRKVLTHRRWRRARAGSRVDVAIRLEPADEAPTLDDLASALVRPARPLFLGRKPFVPSNRILAGELSTRTARGALWEWLNSQGIEPSTLRGHWTATDNADGRPFRSTSVRNWRSGVHAGEVDMRSGTIG